MFHCKLKRSAAANEPCWRNCPWPQSFARVSEGVPLPPGFRYFSINVLVENFFLVWGVANWNFTTVAHPPEKNPSDAHDRPCSELGWERPAAVHRRSILAAGQSRYLQEFSRTQSRRIAMPHDRSCNKEQWIITQNPCSEWWSSRHATIRTHQLNGCFN